MTNKTDHIKKIYFLGIGGIGMSALARYYHAKGTEIYGYDKTSTPLTRQLESEGMHVHYQELPEQIPSDVDLVVYTPAIPEEHLELLYFRKNGFTVLKRAQLLGEITKEKFTIAVAGTHGKTTISSMISHLLKCGGLDITAFVGGICNNYGSNLLIGQADDIMVVEADEFDRSFLTLRPDIAVISSMDADHLDIYGSRKALEESFYVFAGQVKQGGRLVVNCALPMPVKFYSKLVAYGVEGDSICRAEDIRPENGTMVFDLVLFGKVIPGVVLQVPGKHNVMNAVAASAAAVLAGLDAEQVKAGLETYSGVRRRFDYRIRNDQVVYIDDYAHHPRELQAVIESVRILYPGKKITGIFQPHLFSRTRDFLDGFAESLQLLDELILLDIYPAREKPISGISSEVLLAKVKLSRKALVRKEELVQAVVDSRPEVLLTLGAGDIDQFVEPLETALKR